MGKAVAFHLRLGYEYVPAVASLEELKSKFTPVLL